MGAPLPASLNHTQPAALPKGPGIAVAVGATLAVIATAPGQTFIVSLLNTPLKESTGVDVLALNAAYTVATMLGALPLPWLGRLSDRFGPRRLMLASALLLFLGTAVLGAAAGPLTLFVGFFLVRLWGQGALSLTAQHSTALWFHRLLGRVEGIKATALFGAWVFLPPLALWLMAELGWRRGYVVLGGLCAAVVVLAGVFLVKNRPEDHGLVVDAGFAPPPAAAALATSTTTATPAAEDFTRADAVRTRAFWTLAAAMFLAPSVGTAALFDLQTLAAERSLTATDAAFAVSVWTAAMGALALPVGVLVDKVAPRPLLVTGALALAAFPVVLQAAGSLPLLLGAMLVFAVGQSLVGACGAATLARYFGRREHGAIRATVSRVAVLGTGLGPLITGASVRFTGSTALALGVFAVVAVPVVVAAAGLRPPPRPAPPPPPTTTTTMTSTPPTPAGA
jgi:OFA family oxalate/formate antiporter-like MFS transporter